ncbi:TMEM185A isoform 3 [Pongo abelii]|uniref:TMEM185A isoform 3 n=1 Tax=Pongo abelii TaxID=9601 RepID=A0A2J8XTN9_PONAB|nr:TMEM185A isoform 3 [Pongo abelii]
MNLRGLFQDFNPRLCVSRCGFSCPFCAWWSSTTSCGPSCSCALWM